MQRDLAGARLRPLRAAGGREAAPGGLGAAWGWPTVTLGSAGAAATRLACRRGRVHASDRVF